MEVRQIPMAQGKKWVKEGYVLFVKSPSFWFAALGIFTLLFGFLAAIPLIGAPLALLLFPIVVAGFIVACRQLESTARIEFSSLVGQIKPYAAQLVTVGGICLVGMIAVNLIIIKGWPNEFAALYQASTQAQPNEAQLATAMKGLLMPTLAGLLLITPLMMAAWFAPVLVIWHGLSAMNALKVSFQASLRNALPFTVYGLILLGLDVIVSAILGLLLGLITGLLGAQVGAFLVGVGVFTVILVFAAIVIASVYVSYQDIFVADTADAKNDVAKDV